MEHVTEYFGDVGSVMNPSVMSVPMKLLLFFDLSTVHMNFEFVFE
jgi:hypothetical protein